MDITKKPYHYIQESWVLQNSCFISNLFRSNLKNIPILEIIVKPFELLRLLDCLTKEPIY